MVCIIGDKYGYKPVPVKIDKDVFEMLLGSVKSHQGGKNAAELLQQWYKLDENSLPAVYVLQPVSTFHPHAFKRRENEADEAKARQDRQKWWQAAETMGDALKKAASQVDFKAFPLSEMTEEDFKISVTEEEITNGMKGDDMDPNNMLLFLRSLKGLDDVDLNNNAFAKRFVDSQSGGANGDDAKVLLRRLKDNCQNLIPERNICRYVLLLSHLSSHLQVLSTTLKFKTNLNAVGRITFPEKTPCVYMIAEI